MKNRHITISLLIFFSISWILACGPSSDKKNGRIADDKPKYSMDTFSTFPPEIASCSAYYATDSNDFSKQAYIVMGDCGEMAFLKLNGVLTKFLQTDLKKITDQHIIQTYKANKLEMVLDIQDGELTGSEVWRQTGTVILKDEEGKTVTKKLFGECGY